jgi:hypothetical protein
MTAAALGLPVALGLIGYHIPKTHAGDGDLSRTLDPER